jgi:hypothetical protein
MEIDSLTDGNAIFSAVYKNIEENSPWNGHNVKKNLRIMEKTFQKFSKKTQYRFTKNPQLNRS